ncbi:MAG: quinol:cytochrome C oxidoreductase [Pirellulaceae bacterium]
MHERRPGKVTSPIVSLSTSYVKLVPFGLILAALGFGIGYLMSGGDFQRFSFSYLTVFCTALSTMLGCLFFVVSQHLTRAGWSATVRRIGEIYAMSVPLMLLLFLVILVPILLMNYSAVYGWVKDGWTGGSPNPSFQELKDTYLNKMWFGIRIVAYFSIWGLMAWSFFGTSLKQDTTGDKLLSRKMQKSATWKMIIFAATIVFASFDLEMSLAPRWFSTMFPVYFFAGGVMSAFALISLTSLLLQRSGRVTDEITTEHYHDLAKLTFAFVFFWGYIAFSQFLLIWYANLPEETFWYRYRMADLAGSGWKNWSLLLLFGHLFIPFLGLMARTVRRNKTYLLFANIYILVMHWVDHYWIIMPQLGTMKATDPETAPLALPFNPLIDIPMLVGITGIVITFFCVLAADRPLIALKDPRLEEALNYKNV